MDIKEILGRCDHTLLTVGCTWDEIKEIIDDGIKYSTASVCIPACYVKRAKEYSCGNIKICTVIGFPNGYSTTESKVFETRDAIKNGADEIDMVINVGSVKAGDYDSVLSEINAVKEAADGRLLKVIVETCLLTDCEKVKLCEVVSLSAADYIKTSTGFSKGGATPHDVELFSKHVTNGKLIKAAGGISSIEDAELFVKLGASRLGTSRIVKIVKNQKGEGY